MAREDQRFDVARQGVTMLLSLFLLLLYLGHIECVKLKPDYPRKTCGKGEYFLQEEGRCFLCPPGYFMSDSDHRHEACNPCSKVVPGSYQVILSYCNRASDTVFGCPDNRYKSRKNDKDFDCYLCTNCTELKKFEVNACQKDKNSFCCDEPRMVVEEGKCRNVSTNSSPQGSLSTKGSSPTTPNIHPPDINSETMSSRKCTCDTSSSEKQPDSYKDENITLIVVIVILMIIIAGLVMLLIRERRASNGKVHVAMSNENEKITYRLFG